MNIPEKAIDAAWAAHDHTPELDRVQAILEAAAPYIAAQALRDVMKETGVRVRRRTDYGFFEETVYSRDALASRANDMEASGAR